MKRKLPQIQREKHLFLVPKTDSRDGSQTKIITINIAKALLKLTELWYKTQYTVMSFTLITNLIR